MPKLRTVHLGLRTMDARTIKVAEKKAEPFYLSAPWRKLMAQIIAERGRRCEDCGRTNTRIFGDHVHELKDGGAQLDKRNVRLRCGSCHTRKTAAARAERLRAR